MEDPHLKQVYHATFVKLMEEMQVILKASGLEITDEFVVMIVSQLLVTYDK